VVTVSSGGVLRAGVVWQMESRPVSASRGLLAASVPVQVRDSNPDNFGTYGGDLIPDSWQIGYFGLNNPQGTGGADPDGDDADNRLEFLTGTHPGEPGSVFRPTSSTAGGSWQVTFPSVPGRYYLLEYSTTLAGGSWAPWQAPVVGTGGILSFPVPQSGARRFYRITPIP
jgi:hypothetical protein